MIREVITEAHACGSKVGLCGQAPSDHADFAAFLVAAGIDSISAQSGQLHCGETPGGRRQRDQGWIAAVLLNEYADEA